MHHLRFDSKVSVIMIPWYEPNCSRYYSLRQYQYVLWTCSSRTAAAAAAVAYYWLVFPCIPLCLGTVHVTRTSMSMELHHRFYIFIPIVFLLQ